MKSRQILLFYYILLLFHFFIFYCIIFFLRLRKSNQRLRIIQHTNVSGRLCHAIYYIFFLKKKAKTSIEFQNLMVQFCYLIRYQASLSSTEASLCCREAGENELKRASALRFLFFDYCLFFFYYYLDTNTQWQALRRRELRH